ncbi:CoA transferase [Aurantiacibacter xanthus]|uniref:CoA transferase n=1 Tax=Aurantiacibacter xanthus TaxID=1784712 RepID=A0A3A1P0T5_9SPHN|nr:CoA transferase [Aurantiacibacter xanthus]RIV80106.1 CoA transferase [Aurantiacibacter xanthus]
MLSLLKGIRVLDLTTVVLGPYATQILADFGADVIKVEPPTGDVFRSVRPGHSKDLGAGFLNTNRNKRSIGIDLRNDAGQEAFRGLVRQADVVVHNMRPKAARKLGVDFDTVKRLNPQIVYCFAAGFAHGSEREDDPAYDDTIQAAAGLAYLNSNADGEPRFVPTILADKVGGLHLALAVLAALASPARGSRPLCIEAPMFESLVSFLMVEQLAGRTFDPPLGGIGYARLLPAHRKPFRTKDGYISLLPYTAQHWSRFLRLVGRDDLCSDPRVTDSVERSRNVGMLSAIIEEFTPHRTTDEWIALLREHDIPHARVNRIEDLLDDPELGVADMITRFEHPTEGTLLSVRSPFNVVGEEAPLEDKCAPALGADTSEVLREAGFDEAAIARLLEQGGVYGPQPQEMVAK